MVKPMSANSFFTIIFQLVVLLFSVILHEISHGAMALYLGDETAKRQGRLTFNPLKHLDPFGSIILPLILAIPIFLGGKSIIVGWAKPVPYNPYNLKNPRRDAALIGAAGPLANLATAVIFTLLLHLPLAAGNQPLVMAFSIIVLLNLLLAVFNLFPIPPLDGSKILFALIPQKAQRLEKILEANSLLLILAFIIFALPLLQTIVFLLFNLLLWLAGIKSNLLL